MMTGYRSQRTIRPEDSPVPALLARARFWLGVAAVILIASMLLPPAAGYARQYAFVQALQFVIFAVAGPALLMLAVPWRARPAGYRSAHGPVGQRSARRSG